MNPAEVYQAHPTQDEIDEVLDRRGVAAIGTLNEDGSIHLTYVIYLHEGGRLFFETSSVTRKARNAAARTKASFLVHGTASSGRAVMVPGEGEAHVIDGPEAIAINHRIRKKYVTDEAIAGIDRAWAKLDDVAIEITPKRWRSWTGAVLREQTERAGGLDYDAAWRED